MLRLWAKGGAATGGLWKAVVWRAEQRSVAGGQNAPAGILTGQASGGGPIYDEESVVSFWVSLQLVNRLLQVSRINNWPVGVGSRA